MAAPRLNIKRDCTHPGRPHEHGTIVAYSRDRCRCPKCRTVKVADDSRRRRTRVYGTFVPPLIDAQPARAHVRALMAAGMGLDRIGAAAGISHGVTRRLLYGNLNYPPSVKIRRENAAALLTVTVDLAAGQFIDATGTRRRMQALAAIGWSVPELSRRLGHSSTRAWQFQRTENVTVRNARAIQSLYDQLWNQAPPRSDRYERIAATKAANVAASHGWAPPMAWDDDTIDNPNARPAGHAPTPQPKPLTSTGRPPRRDTEEPADPIAVERAIHAATIDGDAPTDLTIPEREALIAALHDRGWPHTRIAKAVRVNHVRVKTVLAARDETEAA